MTLQEAMEYRSSVRRYTDAPIEEPTVKALKKIITHYNRRSGLSFKWIEDGSAAFSSFLHTMGRFKGVRSLIALKGNKDAENLYEKIGRYGERIVLEAVSLGLGTCWVSGSFDRNCVALSTSEDEELVAVITVGYPVPDTKPEIFQKIQPLLHRKIPLKKMYICDSPPADWFMQGIGAARNAPSGGNRQPVRFFYMNGVVLASVRNIDSPPLVDLGIAKSHFELAVPGKFDYGNGGLFTKRKDT